jgi:hypothetical protein
MAAPRNVIVSEPAMPSRLKNSMPVEMIGVPASIVRLVAATVVMANVSSPSVPRWMKRSPPPPASDRLIVAANPRSVTCSGSRLRLPEKKVNAPASEAVCANVVTSSAAAGIWIVSVSLPSSPSYCANSKPPAVEPGSGASVMSEFNPP